MGWRHFRSHDQWDGSISYHHLTWRHFSPSAILNDVISFPPSCMRPHFLFTILDDIISYAAPHPYIWHMRTLHCCPLTFVRYILKGHSREHSRKLDSTSPNMSPCHVWASCDSWCHDARFFGDSWRHNLVAFYYDVISHVTLSDEHQT